MNMTTNGPIQVQYPSFNAADGKIIFSFSLNKNPDGPITIKNASLNSGDGNPKIQL